MTVVKVSNPAQEAIPYDFILMTHERRLFSYEKPLLRRGVEGEARISVVDAIGILIQNVIKKRIPASFCAVLTKEANDVIVNSAKGFNDNRSPVVGVLQ